MIKRLNKIDQRIVKTAAVLMLLALYFMFDDRIFFLGQDSNSSPVGISLSSTKDVRRKPSGQFFWRTLRDDETVYLGDSVFTGPGSSVRVNLQGRGYLVIPENSLIKFTMVGNQLNLDLQFGKVSGQFAAAGPVVVNGKEMNIGGDFEISENGDLGKNTPLRESIQFAEQLPKVFAHSENTRPFETTWSSAEPLGRYHLQIASDPDFKKMFVDQTTFSSRLGIKGYPRSGTYFVRILGDDLSGKPVATSKIQQIDFKNFPIPVITQPLKDTVYTYSEKVSQDHLDNTEVHWKSPHGSSEFEIELALEKDFLLPKAQLTVAGLKGTLPALTAGHYYVRVREKKIDLLNIPGDWSAPVHFEVQKKAALNLAAPVLLTQTLAIELPAKENDRIQWNAVDGAAAYVVETSSSALFEKSERSEVIVTNSPWSSQTIGRKYFRIAALSADKEIGPYSDVGTAVIAAARPILNPVSTKVVEGKTPDDPGEPQTFDLSWKGTPTADKYKIQVADNPRFAEAKEYEARGPASQIQIEKPGDYFWRVQPVTEGNLPVTGFSQPGVMQYVLNNPLATPTLIEPMNNLALYFQEEAGGHFWFEWSPVTKAAKYTFELSRDPEFATLITQRQVTSTRVLVKEKLQNGQLYWRVRAEGSDGRISYWTPTSSFVIYTGRIPAGRR